ncbi:hypothetical protein C0995_001708 [Termitomyces sp. Mi166|nr:hypothetical protein C0995_001708 [Termitomyces sp. Mi166\
MSLELFMVQLWKYIFNPPATLHQIYEPQAYRALEVNNRLACFFIKRAISASEQKLCVDEWNPVRLWEYLKEQHGGAILVQQICLLQKALTMKCSLLESLTKTANIIFKKIEHAFQTEEVTKKLLQLITILSATLIKKDSNTIIATESLILKKDLYALDLYHDYTFAIHTSLNLRTWHNCLSHANYQAILQMA